MRSKLVVAAFCSVLLLCVTLGVGCGKKAAVGPPPSAAVTPERAKKLIAILEGTMTSGPFGMDVKAGASEQLGDMGQVAKDAGAVPVLTKLSKSSKATKEAKAAAEAALAKLNGAAAAP